MWFHRSLLLLLVGAVCAAGVRQATTPVAKVAGLLTKLREKIQEEGKQEAAGYDKYACFCKAQADGKQHAIDTSDAKISELTAAVGALGADIAQLDSDVASRMSDLQTEQNQSAAAVAARQTAQAAFQQRRDNLTDAVAAITSAMETLRASRDGVRGVKAAALLSKLPAHVAALVEVAAESAAGAAQPAYEYRSDDVYSVLQSLLRTFKGQLARVEEEEASAQHDHNMLEGARAQKVMAIQSEIDQKQKISAEKSEDKSSKEGLLSDETSARNADKAFLDELTLNCQSKAQTWDQRSKARAQEITAITEAIGILKGMGDLYNVNRKLVGLAQQSQSVVSSSGHSAPIAQHRSTGSMQRPTLGVRPSLLQLAEEPSNAERTQAALTLLAERGAALGSPVLLALGAKNATGGDPFVRVRGLVKDLITRLEAEAASEATSKSLCDSSMKSAVEKRDKYKAEMELKSVDIDSAESQISNLKGEVAELASQIADLHKALNDLTELRSDEKARNNMTVADAQAGALAVRQAISVLKSFYDAQGGTLLQLRNATTDREGNTVSDLAPNTFSGDYQGKQTESKGILGLLEVIASDFERTSTTTAGEEAQAASDFQTQSSSLESDISAKTLEKDTKGGEIQSKESSLIQLQDDLKTAQGLHTAAVEELDVLKSSCVDSEETWEERKQRREQEIDALKQALAILEDWKS